MCVMYVCVLDLCEGDRKICVYVCVCVCVCVCVVGDGEKCVG